MKRKEREQVEEMYQYYHYRCFLTGGQATQRAHIIGDTKPNRKKYGNEIIDNPLNWLPASDLKSNALIDVGKNSILAVMVVDAIKRADREEIEILVRANIARKRSKLI